MEAAGKRYISHGSRKDRFRIWNFSDLHMLAEDHAANHLARDIKQVAEDPFSFWIGGGDYVDCISRNDPRFSPDSVSKKLTISDLGRLGEVGFREVRNTFAPIADKCLGLLIGNHELQYMIRKEQEDRHAWLCMDLGVPNLNYSSFFDVVFVRNGKRIPTLSRSAPEKEGGNRAQFRVWCHHGAGMATTPGGKMNRLIKAMADFRADIYMMGHVHDRMARRQPVLGADAPCANIVQFDRLGVISGSYLKTYTDKKGGLPSYGEQRLYSPTSLGAASVKIHPDSRTMTAEV